MATTPRMKSSVASASHSGSMTLELFPELASHNSARRATLDSSCSSLRFPCVFAFDLAMPRPAPARRRRE
eukprot:589565-Prymnesium_polylepis.1